MTASRETTEVYRMPDGSKPGTLMRLVLWLHLRIHGRAWWLDDVHPPITKTIPNGDGVSS